MAPRPEPRTEAAKQALQSLRTYAATVQRNRHLADAEMGDILGSLRAAYARRACAVTPNEKEPAA
jgi:hypothetical protein